MIDINLKLIDDESELLMLPSSQRPRPLDPAPVGDKIGSLSKDVVDDSKNVLSMYCVSAIISRLIQVVELPNHVLSILELN